MSAKNKRYILSHKIASGGMAEIYLGKQIGEDGFSRLCCIKRIRPEFSKDKEFIKMFKDEAHVSKRLQHTNIVRIEGFEEVESSYALIMEFVNGSDLQEIIASCHQQSQIFPIAMIIYTIAEACRGLHYAHNKIDEISNKDLGIIHRDISPQNIMVSFEGEVKVTDFGIAKIKEKEEKTKTGIVKGKYSYMSPEQIRGQSLDARTDIYALSIVMWEALAMKKLFQGKTEVDTIQKVSQGTISENILDLNKDIKPELAKILMKGLSKDPYDRYQTANDFEKKLREYLNKNYSEFTPQDYSLFLKGILSSKKNKYSSYIKEVLSKKHTLEKKTPIIIPEDLPKRRVKTFVKPLPQTSLFKQIITATIIALFIGTSAHVFKYNKSYKHIFRSIKLTTNPSFVKISLNNKPLFKGSYIKTPINIENLGSSNNLVIKIEKEGFKTKTITLKENEPSLNTKINLESFYPVTQLKVKNLTTKKPMLVINEGSYFSKIPAKSLNKIPLIIGQDTLLSIYPNYPNTYRHFTCAFKAQKSALIKIHPDKCSLHKE
jgi:serine/threonine protein kinase